MLFGNKVRELREKQGLVLRQLAAALEIDTATMSKIELGDRQARKDQVTQLAEILNADTEYLYTLWLASKVYEVIEGEDMAIEALKVAEEEVQYQKSGRA
ncbi:MAG: helix-turn-helix transcriptional regulator [Bacteroidetes bacterium]|nr:helix-turn-helix transcriptional regulator [Bacteroidota bacterium]